LKYEANGTNVGRCFAFASDCAHADIRSHFRGHVTRGSTKIDMRIDTFAFVGFDAFRLPMLMPHVNYGYAISAAIFERTRSRLIAIVHAGIACRLHRSIDKRYENASDRSRFVLLIRAAVIPFHRSSSILTSRVHALYNSRMTVIARVKNVAPTERERERTVITRSRTAQRGGNPFPIN